MTPTHIATIRRGLGLTQAGFAALLGIGRQYVAKIETGAALPSPSLVLLMRYVERYGVLE